MSFYTDFFTGLGKFQGESYHIEVDPNVTPKKTSCRPVPTHQQDTLKQQLAGIQTGGSLKPVDHATPWINSFVIVK